MHPHCFVCTYPCDPVDVPLMRVGCGHTLCSFCVDRLVKLRKPCPFCNDPSQPLRHRDIRTMEFSVVDTSVNDDQTQVHFYIQGLLREREQLFQTTSANYTELKTSSHRIRNQYSTLSRLSAKADRIRSQKKRTISELEDADRKLLKATEDHDALLTELATAEQQLREAGRLANIRPSKVHLPYLADTPSYVRGVKRVRETDVGERGLDRIARRRRIA